MDKFISFSGGVESRTMCLLYGKGATAIWCDTGDEEPELYAAIDEMEVFFTDFHNGDFKLKRIIPNVNSKAGVFHTLTEGALIWSMFPSQSKRWCTERLKITPIDNFLREKGECELMIGFNADEEPGGERKGNSEKLSNIHYSYPLFNDGVTRNECESLLNKYGIHPNFPIYMKRGGCRKCFYKGRKELKAKYIFNREGFLEDREFEEKMNRESERKKFYAINISAGSYASIQKEVDDEIAQWGYEEVKSWYKKVETHKPCGAFCHR